MPTAAPDPPPLLAPDLAERLEALFAEQGWTLPGGAQAFAEMALKRGIGLVDPERRSALVDLKVYAGACWRLNRWRELAEARPEAWPAKLVEAERLRRKVAAWRVENDGADSSGAPDYEAYRTAALAVSIALTHAELPVTETETG